MPLTVFFAIIFAAFLHAVWNAMVKKGDDKYISLTAVVLGHVPISIVVIFFTPTLSFQSIPYIFISAGSPESKFTVPEGIEAQHRFLLLYYLCFYSM